MEVIQLQRRSKRKSASDVASTFRTMEEAEWAVAQILRANKLKIYLHSKSAFLLKKPRLSLTMELNKSIGWGIERDTPDIPIEMTKVRVIIEYQDFNTMPMYILSAFPVL